MFRRIIGIFVLLVMTVAELQAQYDPSFSNYWAMSSYYNPAATGQDGLLNVNGAYAMQMTGFENAPATMFASVDLPLFFVNSKHGVGAGFMNDQIGLFKHQQFYVQYAYHQPLWGGRLSGGIHLGMLSENFDGTGLDLNEDNDPAFPTSEASGAGFDLNFGLQYTRKPTYYLMGGYNISLKNPLYTIHTSAMMRTDFVGYRGDLTARLAYHGNKHELYGGLSYSPTISVSFLFGGDFHGVNLGYAYELYTSAIGALSGSHEIIIGYKTELNLFKKGKNKHKSVRIL